MRAFTRWVLAHRKTVFFSWLVIFVVAVASTQSSVDALSDQFDLPGRESSDAANLIYAKYGNGGPRVGGPLVQVVKLPDGTTVDSPGREASRSATPSGRSRAAVPGSRSADYASTGDRMFVSKDGSTTFGVIWYPPSTANAFDSAGPALKETRAAAATTEVAGAPVRITGIDALVSVVRREQRPERPARDPGRRPRRPDRAAVRVRIADGVRAAPDGRHRHPHHLPDPVASRRGHRGLGGGAVPDLADRPRRGDRLRPADRDALARGARRRAGQPRVGRGGHGARREGRHHQRRRGGHRPAGAGGAARAVPAQHRLRGHADPPRQRAGGRSRSCR